MYPGRTEVGNDVTLFMPGVLVVMFALLAKGELNDGDDVLLPNIVFHLLMK